MGMFCIYSCTSCGHEVTTWGPQEFYRDASGNRQPYGHPGPCSEEARSRGIAGFEAQKYCTRCGKTQRVILGETQAPCLDPIEAWRSCGGLDAASLRGAARCPDCGSEALLLTLPEDRPVACPRCGRGVMVLSGGGVG